MSRDTNLCNLNKNRPSPVWWSGWFVATHELPYLITTNPAARPRRKQRITKRVGRTK